MSVAILMDLHVDRAITLGLRHRGVDVLTAQEGQCDTLEDPELLDRATSHQRILFSQDDDLLVEASSRQRSGKFFAGLIYSHQITISVRSYIDELELISKVYDPPDMANRVEWIPLR